MRHAAVAGFAVGIALVLWFGLWSSFPDPARTFLPFRFDLAEHAASFCWLGLTGQLLWKKGWIVLSCLILSAGLLEIVQMAAPLHESSLLDWYASTIGAITGSRLSLLARRLPVARRVWAPQGRAS
jgi:VanZ family protein